MQPRLVGEYMAVDVKKKKMFWKKYYDKEGTLNRIYEDVFCAPQKNFFKNYVMKLLLRIKKILIE